MASSGNLRTIHFPAQKKSINKKDEDWRKDNIDAAEDYVSARNEGFRKDAKNKRINYDLYSDILDQQDVERVCNPFKLKNLTSPAEMQNYPIANPKIDLLFGEALKRKLDIRVRVNNPDAISEKEKDLKGKFSELINQMITDGLTDEQQIQQKLSEFERFRTYEYQDHRERMATHILTHLQQKLKIDQKFAKGFKDALLVAEEIYQVDVVAGEPIMEKLNPKYVTTIRSGESPFIEDSDVIVLKNWYSPGRIIDEYHEELTPKQIDQIEEGSFAGTGSAGNIDIGERKPIAHGLDSLIDTDWFENENDFGEAFDEDGNIRVIKVYWKSRRKMLKVTSIDDFGDEVVSLEDEFYKIDENIGETKEVLWVNEWWEGHKIGGSSVRDEDRSFYVRMQPRPIQFRNMENPSKCSPGIIGTIYQTNDNSAVSLMDRMKPYQYMYNILMYNTELAIAKNHGKIMSLDLARVPENWKIDQWMSYAQGMNLAVYDSFKEGNKGAATGKLAGGQNQPSPVIDLEMGNTIQLYINMLSYIKSELGEISGVSGARAGQISNREAVGNVEREVVQTSHITEYWFAEHEATQIRVLEALLETAKFAWKDDKSKKVQYVLDEGSTAIFDLDGEQFNEADYDITITTGSMNDNLRDSLKQLAHAGLQNGMINFSQLLDIMTTNSVSSIKRKIQRAEEDAKQSAQKQQEQEAQQVQQQLQQQAQMEQAKAEAEVVKQEKELEDNQKDRDNAILLKQLDLQAKAGQEGSGEALEKLRLDAEKIRGDLNMSDKELTETVRSNKAKEEIERQKVAAAKIAKKSQSGK